MESSANVPVISLILLQFFIFHSVSLKPNECITRWLIEPNHASFFSLYYRQGSLRLTFGSVVSFLIISFLFFLPFFAFFYFKFRAFQSVFPLSFQRFRFLSKYILLERLYGQNLTRELYHYFIIDS